MLNEDFSDGITSEILDALSRIEGLQVTVWIEWDVARALVNMNKALELKPSFPDALM